MADRLTVRTALAPLLGEPRISQALTSQLLLGATVTCLESRGDWRHVRGEDGYEGWTHMGYLSPCTGSERTWRLSLGCRVRTADGTTMPLPLGARVPPSSDVIDGVAIAADTREVRFPGQASAIAESAVQLFAGASYLWGGVTPWGCDCSGFVQRVFAMHGIALPRDAWQQAGMGTELAADAAMAHEAASLLFFSDRDDKRVTHVGIALGDGRMIHSALTRGGVAVEQMDGSDAYVERLRAQCTGVRRVL